MQIIIFVPLCLKTFAIRVVIIGTSFFHSQFSLRYGKHVSAQRNFEINKFVELLVLQSEKVNNLNIALITNEVFRHLIDIPNRMSGLSRLV